MGNTDFKIDKDGTIVRDHSNVHEIRCSKCGNIIVNDSLFCKFCGAKVETDIPKNGLLKNNYSEFAKNEIISWKDVAVTRNVNDTKGLDAVKTITKKSGWGGLAIGAGFRSCVKQIQQEAAKNGCRMVVIINENYGFITSLTATLYKRS